MTPIISIVGTSGSGKTTLLERLLPVLKSRGYRVGTVKHASHAVEFDKRGKDSWRHKAAGADTVIVASGNRISMVKEMGCDSLDSLALYFQDLDLVITEGYKRENRPKIEVYRPETGKAPIFLGSDLLVALVTDAEVNAAVPRFAPDDIEGLADFIRETFLGAAVRGQRPGSVPPRGAEACRTSMETTEGDRP